MTQCWALKYMKYSQHNGEAHVFHTNITEKTLKFENQLCCFAHEYYVNVNIVKDGKASEK